MVYFFVPASALGRIRGALDGVPKKFDPIRSTHYIIGCGEQMKHPRVDHFWTLFSAGGEMASDCFKRYRMELDLSGPSGAMAPSPEGYLYMPWHPELLDLHAQVKFESFQGEIDAHVFPCLGDADGCRRLMGEIVERRGFLPGATWLAVYHPNPGLPAEYCGTIQGIIAREGHGSIQNVGVTPLHRDSGIGRGLIARALHGFRAAGLSKASLEVTAKNVRAVQLYRRLGFRCCRTVYKTTEVAELV